MAATRIDDPFPTTADPAGYVPWEGAERALDALARRTLEEAPCLALTGPPGLGKTTVLQVLVERLEGRARPVYLPYPALDLPGLCAWALEALGEPCADDPEAALVAHARRQAAEGTPLVLLIDDAAQLPVETARALAELSATSEGASLRIVAAATDGLKTGRVLAALGPALEEVRLAASMSVNQVVVYIRTHLDRAAARGAVRSRFDAMTVARLHRESRGVPRQLQQLAGMLALGIEPWPEAPAEDDPAPFQEPDRAARDEAGSCTSPRAPRSSARSIAVTGLVALLLALALPSLVDACAHGASLATGGAWRVGESGGGLAAVGHGARSTEHPATATR